MTKDFSVIHFSPYRRYPTASSQQTSWADEHKVCSHCLSGACCSSEGPIALTSFDILRLATFFAMDPAELMIKFTQDRFGGELDDERYRSWIEDPDSSVVTFLRRRANFAASPCIFLKYVLGADGTPRRICSVHPARPLACREFYYDVCKKRWTGELAVILTQGFEMVRDRKITPELIAANCKRLEPVLNDDSLTKKWQYAFWSEMRRVLDVERANNEGANSYAITECQDPIDEKLNRLLSSRYLRFEEKYGPEPHGEQIQPYSAGRSFKGSPDYERILRVIRTVPKELLFLQQDYPHFIGVRTLMPGVGFSTDFGYVRAHPSKKCRYARAMTQGWNFLITLAAHAKHIGELIEMQPWGTFELALLEALSPFDNALQQRVTGTCFLSPARRWASKVAACVLLELYRSIAARHAGAEAWIRLYASATRFHPSGTPRNIKQIARIIRTETRRNVFQHTRRRQVRRWLGPQVVPKSLEAWERLFEQLPVLCGVETLRTAKGPGTSSVVLDLLSAAHVFKPEATRVFQILDEYTRARRILPTALRRRAAEIALRHAAYLEQRGLWEGELLQMWPSLCRRLCIAGSQTPGFVRSVEYLVSTQGRDGSWAVDLRPTELPHWQSDYLVNAVRTTSLAIEGLSGALLTQQARG